MRASDLPYLGLGLSSNLDSADLPHPYQLLDREPGLFDFIEYSAPLSIDQARAQASLFDAMWSRREQVPALYHPVHLNLWGPTLEPTEALEQLDRHAREVGSVWVGNDIGWWHEGGQPFPGYLYVTPPLNARGLDQAERHVNHVQSALSVPLVIENPAVLAVRGELHVLDFMAELQKRTGAPLLVDLGHLWSYQLSRGLPPTAGLDGFPIDQVVELHIAGGVVTQRGSRRFYVDDHTQPVREELFGLLDEVLPRCTSLRALTFEGDGHPDAIAALTLRRLRTKIKPRTAPVSPPLTHQVRPESTTAPERFSSAAWELFAEVHGAAPATADPEGTAAELDFRLAVIAEQLDLRFPLSRLILAGTRDALVAFASSSAYRSVFEDGKTLEQAYASWSRRRAMEVPGADAVVAFEAWVDGVLHRGGHAGRQGTGVFPVDLSELLFAAGALRRHLSQRAWASGTLELSALDALVQTVQRAPRSPWTVSVRRLRRRLEIFSGTGAAHGGDLALQVPGPSGS